MSEPRIVRYSYEEAMSLSPGETDWERVRNITDEEIAAAVADDPDAVPVGLDWSDAELVIPKKQPVSIRLDEDVLTYFKETGPRYQTRINEVLRRFMKAQKAKAKKKA
ncbi:BrnA antitoxin family protein [Parvibaculum sp.]|uniref:BrnA antitoxin family protein n=1 Tax=Parvibaculum sp. TaxID=2024848 RepID=UPI00329962B2